MIKGIITDETDFITFEDVVFVVYERFPFGAKEEK